MFDMKGTIDGSLLSQMIVHGAASINAQKQQINELNVFPVPDGDTGTNMSMTISTASAELRKKPLTGVGAVAQVNANALLRGARGNSGVILSLLFRGLSKALKGMETADAAAFAAAGTTSARLVVGTSYRPDHHQAHGESAQCLQCVFHHHFLWILSLY